MQGRMTSRATYVRLNASNCVRMFPCTPSLPALLVDHLFFWAFFASLIPFHSLSPSPCPLFRSPVPRLSVPNSSVLFSSNPLRHPSSMEEGTGPLPSEPPPLPYSLHTRKKSIAIFWILFVVDTLGQPIGLYWGLWYGTNLTHNLGMFVADAISTTALTWRCFSVFHRHSILGWYLGPRILLSSL